MNNYYEMERVQFYNFVKYKINRIIVKLNFYFCF